MQRGNGKPLLPDSKKKLMWGQWREALPQLRDLLPLPRHWPASASDPHDLTLSQSLHSQGPLLKYGPHQEKAAVPSSPMWSVHLPLFLFQKRLREGMMEEEGQFSSPCKCAPRGVRSRRPSQGPRLRLLLVSVVFPPSRPSVERMGGGLE